MKIQQMNLTVVMIPRVLSVNRVLICPMVTLNLGFLTGNLFMYLFIKNILRIYLFIWLFFYLFSFISLFLSLFIFIFATGTNFEI